MKKDGGTIKNWQTHKLTFTKKQIESSYPGSHAKPIMFTGTVVKDPTGRWKPGHHMRSSLVVSLNRKTGICETINTMYKLIGKEGGDIFPDLGNKILDVYY